MNPTIECVLFDLDGTLADTAPDMIAALNVVLREEQQPPLALSEARDHVSNGSAALVRLAFGEQQSEDDFDRRKKQFLARYELALCVHTALFPGMAELLDTIENNGHCWGVVTNKPGWLTDPLMAALGLTERAVCIISGDTLAERKPHPLPMLTAAEHAGVHPSNCLYIGDAERDIEAGNAADMLTLIAHYGYITAEQHPEAWGADGGIDHPLDALNWLDQSRRSA